MNDNNDGMIKISAKKYEEMIDDLYRWAKLYYAKEKENEDIVHQLIQDNERLREEKKEYQDRLNLLKEQKCTGCTVSQGLARKWYKKMRILEKKNEYQEKIGNNNNEYDKLLDFGDEEIEISYYECLKSYPANFRQILFMVDKVIKVGLIDLLIQNDFGSEIYKMVKNIGHERLKNVGELIESCDKKDLLTCREIIILQHMLHIRNDFSHFNQEYHDREEIQTVIYKINTIMCDIKKRK